MTNKQLSLIFMCFMRKMQGSLQKKRNIIDLKGIKRWIEREDNWLRNINIIGQKGPKGARINRKVHEKGMKTIVYISQEYLCFINVKTTKYSKK